MFLSLKTLYRKRTVIWPFYFYTIIRTLSNSVISYTLHTLNREDKFENYCLVKIYDEFITIRIEYKEAFNLPTLQELLEMM